MRLLNLSGPQDLMALVVRRKRWIIYPFIALSCAVAVVTWILPKLYVSEAVILIHPRDVPTDFVKDLIAGSTEFRINSIQQTVLSRNNLKIIARDFDLPEFRSLNMDDRIAKLRNQIKVIFRSDENAGNSQLPLVSFRITYQNRDPVMAQKIADRVTTLFIKKDLEMREEQVNGTVEFVGNELSILMKALKESDAKLRILKARHRNELPSNLESNLRRVESAIGSQQSYAEQDLQIGRMVRDLQQRIDETQPKIPKPVAPRAPQSEVSPDPNIAKLRAYKLKQREYADNGFGEGHPSVQTLNLTIERLKAEMTPEDIELAEKKEEKPKAPAPAEVEMIENPRYVSLLKDKEELMFEISLRERAKKRNDESIETYNRRIENEPQVEEDLVDIVRENTDLNKQVASMKDKLTESELSLSLESKQKAQQFEILNAPEVPQTPTKPQKYAIVAMGTLFSLLGGVVIGFVTDIANQKMWTSSDVEALLGAKVLVEIPEIVTPSDTVLARKKRWRHIAAVLAVAAVYGVALYFIKLNQSTVVRLLEPYLQRLY